MPRRAPSASHRLASGYCDGDEPTPTLEPPLADGADFNEAVAEWEALQNAYFERLYCNPLNPCGDFDLPGEQPADADDARAEVTTLMESMYGAGALLDRLDHVNDSTGIAEALEQFEGGSFDGEVSSAVAIVDDVVFTTPDGATFRYSIRTDMYGCDRRVGAAVRVNDVWKITRGTVCSDFSLGGVSCDLSD